MSDSSIIILKGKTKGDTTVGLKEIIFDAGYNKKDFAKQADIPLSEFEEKLKSLDFYTMEVKNICEILNIPADRIKEVFF